jgi:hypothetical protein
MSEDTMTPRQRDIMKHALGAGKGRPGWRNYFVTGPGSDDYDDCEALVAAGMMTKRNVTPWFPVAVDPVHKGIYQVEYRQSRYLFCREWRDGVWCIPGAVLLPATRPKRWRGLTEPARTMP